MNITDHEIKELIKLVETKLGRPLTAPVDFSLLSLEIEKTLNETISISTIKRLVGYVNDEHHPSITTLNLLARYVGYRNWAELQMQLDETTSGSLNDNIIQSSSLAIGDELEIEWLPDRYCHIRYQGNHLFEVLAVQGSKHLQAGDTFETLVLCLDQPVMATNHIHGEEHRPIYIIGRRHGLTALRKINKE
ncbi:MAG: hypothetical protein IJV05_04075 [Muribaculaceae bacterium]|nr:hypothetical protein [Muribaculaceae bacterium]